MLPPHPPTGTRPPPPSHVSLGGRKGALLFPIPILAPCRSGGKSERRALHPVVVPSGLQMLIPDLIAVAFIAWSLVEQRQGSYKENEKPDCTQGPFRTPSRTLKPSEHCVKLSFPQ